MTSSVVSLPEVGQLAEVRERRWIVTDVAASTLPPSPLEPAANGHPHHLVGLSSVEDDGLGEELQIIWEVEPGARVLEKVALPEPTGFDEPRRLDAFLDAVRWGATSTADVFGLRAATHLAQRGGDGRAVRSADVHAYVLGDLDRLVKALDLRPVDAGSTVHLLTPNDEGVLYGTRSIEQTPLSVTRSSISTS